MRRKINTKKITNKNFKISFLEEIERIKNIPKMPNFEYYHIGSTAINDSYGEEILDILLVVDNLHDITGFDEKRLNNICYHRVAHSNKGVISYCRINNFVTMNYDVKLFIVQKDTEIHKNFLLFNDILKNSKEIFEEYQKFKKENYNFKKNTKKYTKKKDIFIKKILNGVKNAKRT